MQLPERALEILKEFHIEDETLVKISEAMLAEFRLGLEKGRPESSVAMIPTFVPQLPTAEESGKYIAIDLSGKNLRIMLLSLTAGNTASPQICNRNFMVPKDVMTGTGDQLFNFIVNCLSKFMSEQEVSNEEEDIPIGFVFSYPCQLTSIRSAHLLWWTKGFNVEDCLQKDVVKLLEDAITLNSTVKARVAAVMNDTVGQLAAGAYEHGEDCVIGVVIGYGCNASYLERVDRIGKFDANEAGYSHKEMVVVTEWEEFGAKGELASILTDYDKDVDLHSIHVGKQIVDKLCGALYLGEVVRGVMEQMVVDNVMFAGNPSDNIQTPDAFPSKYISEILLDEETSNFKNTRRILDELQIPLHGTLDYLILREICHAVSVRSAAIAAAAIAALLEHLQRPSVVIGLGGALIQYHPTYQKLLEDKLSRLAPPTVQWSIKKVSDGSARGAGLVAATANRLKL